MSDPRPTRHVSPRRALALGGSVLMLGSLFVPWVSVSGCECEGPATRSYMSVLGFLRWDQAILGYAWVRPVAVMLVVAAMATAVLGALLVAMPALRALPAGSFARRIVM